MSDDLTPEEAAAAEAARSRTSAQNAAAELARMGIDPRALGLEVSPPTETADGRREATPDAASAPSERARSQAVSTDANVLPLHRQHPAHPDLPAPGTSPAWMPSPPAVAPDSTEIGSVPVPIQPLLGHEPARTTKARAAHLARAVTFGMLTPDAADAAEREREMVGRVRSRQTDRRVVVFLSGRGGVGTTSVAVGVGSVLAALRDDSTTLASLRPGAPSLGMALAGQRAPNARDLARPHGDTADVAPLRLDNGLLLLDGPRWGTPVRRGDVPVIVDRCAQQSTFCLFDVGNDPSESGHSLLSRADQVVIVSGAGTGDVDACRVAAERAADIDPYLLDSAVYVLVCRHDTALTSVVRRMRETMPAGARIVAVPPEPALDLGAPFDSSGIGVATRLAMVDIAGLVALGPLAHADRAGP